MEARKIQDILKDIDIATLKVTESRNNLRLALTEMASLRAEMRAICQHEHCAAWTEKPGLDNDRIKTDRITCVDCGEDIQAAPESATLLTVKKAITREELADVLYALDKDASAEAQA